MRRRDLLILSLAAPLVGRAHAASAAGLPVIGFLSLGSEKSFGHLLSAFHDGLAGQGHVEGKTLSISYRWADGDYTRLLPFARELVAENVALIVSSGGDRPTLAAKDATSSIPIVFIGSDDPVGLGLVDSLARPGGNVTGGSLFTSDLEVKKLELLHEVLPDARRFVMLSNPNNPKAEDDILAVVQSASSQGLAVDIERAKTVAEIDAAFARIAELGVEGLLLGHDPFFNSRREQIVGHVARLSLPAIYEHREFVRAGGLMSYGNDISQNYRTAAVFVSRILAGADPADLPVQQATTFELVINPGAAEALAVELPESILSRADEVVE